MAASFEDKFFQASRGLVPASMLGGPRVALGSVLAFTDGSWSHVGSIRSKFGLNLPRLLAPTAVANSYSGSGGNGFSFKSYAKGSPGKLIKEVADAKARAEVIFGSNRSYMFSVRNQRVIALGNLEKLYHAIRLQYHLTYHKDDAVPVEKQWHPNYAAVIGIASAESWVATRARSKNASMVIQGSGRIGPPGSVGEVSAKMSFSFTEEDIFHDEATDAEGFAFQLARIKPSWWRVWEREIITGRLRSREMVPFSRAYAAIASLPVDADTFGALWSAPPPDGKLPADAFVVTDLRGAGKATLPAAQRNLAHQKAPAKKAAKKRVAAKAARKSPAKKRAAARR